MQLQRPVTRPIGRTTVGGHKLLKAGTVFLCAFLLGGLFSATPYIVPASRRLQAVAPAMSTFDHAIAEAWWSQDAQRIETLAQLWPLSIPTLIGEATVLWIQEQQLVRSGSQDTELGYTIIPSGTAGQLHMLSASVRNRFHALGRRWTPAMSEFERSHYAGYPLSKVQGTAVEPDEVHSFLRSADFPDSILKRFRVVLLPFVLHETAGLGTEGLAILGAAPTYGEVNPNRTAYTLFHEIGHHVHFTYLDGRSPELWSTYMALRGIDTWIASGAVGTETWSHSAQETFAEDFRLLFGPPEARAIPHGTTYGDPSAALDEGENIRSFITDLVSK